MASTPSIALPTFAKIGVLVLSFAVLLVVENHDSSLYHWLQVFVAFLLIEVVATFVSGFTLVAQGVQIISFVWQGIGIRELMRLEPKNTQDLLYYTVMAISGLYLTSVGALIVFLTVRK
jgi:hypothetical protein